MVIEVLTDTQAVMQPAGQGIYGRMEMNRQEFLQKLKEALENDLSGRIVQDNLNYYSQYIADEIKKGRAEQEVVDELGDPWMIARTIIDTQAVHIENETTGEYGSQEQSYDRPDPFKSSGVHIFGLDTWWKKLLVIVAVIAIVCIVFSIITGIISLVAPIAVPVLIIVIIVQIVKKRGR